MKLHEAFKVVGVRKSENKKEPSKPFYNLDLYQTGTSVSVGCTAEVAAQVVEDGKYKFSFDYYPQQVTGFYGLGRLRVDGLLK